MSDFAINPFPNKPENSKDVQSNTDVKYESGDILTLGDRDRWLIILSVDRAGEDITYDCIAPYGRMTETQESLSSYYDYVDEHIAEFFNNHKKFVN